MVAHLAITGRDCGRAEDAARELRAAGGQVDVFVADLSSQPQVRRGGGPATEPERTLSRFGRFRMFARPR